jgi:hypothetical protein
MGCDTVLGLDAPVSAGSDGGADATTHPLDAAAAADAPADSGGVLGDGAPEAGPSAEAGEDDASGPTSTAGPDDASADSASADTGATPLQTVPPEIVYEADAACDPIDAGEGMGASCEQGVEAGCSPDPVPPGGPTSFDLSYPQVPHGSACAPEDIAAIYASCVSRGLLTLSGCATVDPSGAHYACMQCVLANPGPFLTPTQGAENEDPGYYYVNVPACIALAEPCNEACAAAVAAEWACTDASCAYKCQGYAATPEETLTCEFEAQTCACLGQATAANACVSAIKERDSRASFCVGLAGTQLVAAPTLSEEQAVTLMTLFCGE